MSYDNYTFDEQSVYISGILVDGVQSVTTNFQYPAVEENSLGYLTPVATSMDGLMEGEFSASRLLVGSGDTLTGHFSDGVSGHLRYSPEHAYVFETGLISSYSCNCEINELPTLDFTMKTWGKVFGSITGVGDQPGPESNLNQELYLPSAGDIEIEVKDCAGGHQLDISTNAVRSFEYNIDLDWTPLSTLGSQNPQGFFVRSPIEVEAVITLELNDFIPPDFLNSLCNPIFKEITLKVNSCSTDCADSKRLLRKFVLPNGKLVALNQFSDMDDVLLAEVIFKSTNTSAGKVGELVSN